jgi:pyridine nucleotide-disulfide oxidoreductase family protein
MNAGRRQLVLVGGGHAHVQVFHAFAQSPPDCDLTVLVDRPLAMYSGMVPGFVAGRYARDEFSIDLRAWAERLGAELILDRALGLDTDRKLIQRAGGDPVPYDLCSWNIGSGVLGGGLPGVREHALSTRPIGEFVELAPTRLETVLATRRGQALRIAVVGGGAAGVELALCFGERARALGASDVGVHLYNADAELLPGSPPSLRRRIEREFQRRGVRHRCGTRVTEVCGDAVRLDTGESVPADMVVWVTGAASQLAPDSAGLRLAQRGWIPVCDTLQHVDHAEVFAVGDCAELVDHPRTPKAGVYSVREGPVLTHNLRASLNGGTMRSYSPQHDFLALLNLGDGRAAGSKWGRSFSGRWVMSWKDRIDRAFMSKFR